MKIKCVKMSCLVCGKQGSTQLFINRLGQIRYARTRHYSHIDKVSKKPQFTYHKLEDLQALKTLLSNKNIQLNKNKANSGQTGQANNIDQKLRETSLVSRIGGAGSSARIEHHPPNLQRILDQTNSDIDWTTFKAWLTSKYSKSYTKLIYYYSKKYHNLLSKVKLIDLIKQSNRNNVIKALITLSKYLGCYTEFKAKMKNYGIKIHRQSAVESFLRIMKASNSDILDWYGMAIKHLRPNEQIFLRFCKVTGIRKTEAITSFNKIIELSKTQDLPAYYDFQLKVLMHFQYHKEFLRRTKNCYISFVPDKLVKQIASSQPVSYYAIRKRLSRYGIKRRISELRDHFGTHLRKHGITKEEIDLLQGRIPQEIFIRHYWSPKLSELGNRVLNAQRSQDITLIKEVLAQ
ncbi:MAG: integrase [Candidatus Bathyarchaeota archaeon]|nr:integrase [Candidatus Bathyarchaeota archaeon]